MEMVELRRRHFRQKAGKLDHRRMRRVEEGIVIGELFHLPGDGVDDFPAAMADIHAPEPAHAVEDLVALRVIHIDAAGRRDDPDAARIQFAGIRERMQMVRRVDGLKLACVVQNGHGSPSSGFAGPPCITGRPENLIKLFLGHLIKSSSRVWTANI